MNVNIGIKVHELRKAKNLSISDLSKKSGVSTGLISQIERDKVVPSVVNLWKLAKALDTNIGYFFDEDLKEDKLIVRKDDRKKIIINRRKGIYELLSPDMKNRKIEFLMITTKSGEEDNSEMITHEGEECGLVLKGSLTIKLSSMEYVLNEGDSIYFESTIPHRYQNNSAEDCISVWAMTPPSF